MACGDLVGYKPSTFREYLCSLDTLPAPFTDSWSGSRVTFSWQPNSQTGGQGYCPNRAPGELVPSYEATAPKGYEAMVRSIRQALVNHCEMLAGPILPPPQEVLPSRPPPITTTDLERFTGPLPVLDSPEEKMIYTNTAAPTAVPVTRRPTGTVLQPTGMSMPSYPIGFIGAGTGPTLPPGFNPITPGSSVGGIDWNDLIKWGIGKITGGGTSGGETPTSPGTQPTGFAGASCPSGYRWDGQQCVKEGFGGWTERVIPGGSTGVLPTNGTQAAVDQWGTPVTYPMQVGTINGNPILRCKAGAVLGRNNMCYEKGTISNKNRKWPKGPSPLLTGGEMKTLRKIKSLENKVKRAWTAAGKPGQRTCRRK